MPPVALAVATVVQGLVTAAIGMGVITSAIGALAYYATLAAIMYGVSRVLQKNPKLPSFMSDASTRTAMVRQAAAPRRLIYGNVKVSGPVAYIGASGSSNEFLHIVVLLATHEVAAIDDIYLNDELVPLDGSGNATGKYAGYVRVKKHLGAAGDAADPDLISDTGGEWTATDKLSGCAYVYARLKFTADLFPSGMPNVAAMVRGRKVYDSRDGSTAYSTNAALCIYDYMTDATYGLGASASEIDTASIEAAANICDEQVTLALTPDQLVVGQVYTIVTVGTTDFTAMGASANTIGTRFTCTAAGTGDGTVSEDRYSINGTVDTSEKPGSIIEALLSAMSGKAVYAGGKWYIQAGAYETPTVTLDEDDLRGPIDVQTKLSRRELFNGVKGVFVSPGTNWQPTDFPPVTSSTYLTEDNNERLWRDVQLPYTTSASTAQRLAKIELERGRRQITVKLQCMLTAFQVQAGGTVMISNTRLGWSSKVFEVVEFACVPYQDAEGNPALGVDLALRETDANVYAWSAEDEPLPAAETTTLPDPFTVAAPTSPSLTSTTFLQTDGTLTPELQVSWTAPADEMVKSGGRARVNYRVHGTGTWLDAGTIDGAQTTFLIHGLLLGQYYDVRVRSESIIGVASSWAEPASNAASGFQLVRDTTAPAQLSAPTCTAYPGYIKVKWAAAAESDVAEYKVYRYTSNSVSSAVAAGAIAEVSSLEFNDATVTPGTTYYYFVSAVDNSENIGIPSTEGHATAALAPVGATTPSNPTAATRVAAGTDDTYLSGDGSAFAFITIAVPALPSNAVWQNLLYRRNGATDWLVASQLKNTGSTNVRLDDLTPGVAYEVATQAWSGAGGSAIVTATSSPFTAPSRSTAPTAPTGSLSAETAAPGIKSDLSSMLWGCRATIVVPSGSDIIAVEMKVTFTDSDAATNYEWSEDMNGAGVITRPARPGQTLNISCYHADSLTAGNVRVRTVNRTGVPSSWVRLGNANANATRALGDMALQTSTSVNVSGMQVGASGASSIQKVLARCPVEAVFGPLAGSAAYEEFSVSLSNRGFGAKPDLGPVTVSGTDNYNTDYAAFYNYDHGSNSSSVAYFKVFRPSGANTEAGRYVRISGELIENY